MTTGGFEGSMDGFGEPEATPGRIRGEAADGALPDWLAALDSPPRAEEFRLAFDDDLAEMLRVRILGPRSSLASSPRCEGRRRRS